jgi:hypothetical protein
MYTHVVDATTHCLSGASHGTVVWPALSVKRIMEVVTFANAMVPELTARVRLWFVGKATIPT